MASKKRILVDINHPAHVHFFKNFVIEMKQTGHEILITASDKDVTSELLRSYHFEFINIGSYGDHIVTKLINIPIMDIRLYTIAKRFKPDLLLGIASIRAAHVSFLYQRRCILFDDTEDRGTNWLYLPFVSNIYTPACFKRDMGKKQIRYNGYHELAYLHPNRFKPNPEVIHELGLSQNERFFIVRFVSWKASHDIGQSGFTPKGKIQLINKLLRYGKVFITSEKGMPPELRPYGMTVSPFKIHDLLYYATLYIGEGATMASEAAVLGTPAIFVSSLSAGTIQEQEKQYGLLYSFKDENMAMKMAVDLLEKKDLKWEWQRKRQLLLEDKIDVTAKMIQIVREELSGIEMAK